jgi:hypothetical protein
MQIHSTDLSATNQIAMVSNMILYCFLPFALFGRSLVFSVPTVFASRGRRAFSDTYDTIKVPMANISKNILNPSVKGVMFMKSSSQSYLEKSMDVETTNPRMMVKSSGTIAQSAVASRLLDKTYSSGVLAAGTDGQY